MTAVLVTFCVVIGLLIGSFLNVVIHRVPAGESVVRPRSRCPGCGTEIAARDNIPVISWLVLRGQCRNCARPISIRYPLVEAGTAVLFGLVALRFGWDWALPAYLYLAAIGVALSAIDLDTRRLPNAIVLPSYPVAFGLLAGAALLNGEAETILRVSGGGLALFAFYFLLALIYPAGMGFGDVKLAGVLGMYLGYLGWGILIIGGFLGFLVGGLLGIALILFRGAGRKTMLPFGPSMIIGAFLAIFFGQAIADWYGGLLS